MSDFSRRSFLRSTSAAVYSSPHLRLGSSLGAGRCFARQRSHHHGRNRYWWSWHSQSQKVPGRTRCASRCGMRCGSLACPAGEETGRRTLWNDRLQNLRRPTAPAPRANIEAVVISTPDHWHGISAVQAAREGKDIYCEKPLAGSIGEGRAIVDAVNRYSNILQTGSHERSNNSIRFGCELLLNGYIGDLKQVVVNLPTTSRIINRCAPYRACLQFARYQPN